MASTSLPPGIKSLRLSYLPFRAMAETTRFMLHYAGIPYEDEVVWGVYFEQQRRAGKFPFDKVPVMTVEYVQKAEKPTSPLTIAQSGSLARLAAKLAGCYETLPEDPSWCAYNDSIFELGQEMCTINPTLNCYTGAQFARVVEWYFSESFPVNAAYLERQLREVVIPKFSSPKRDDVFFGGLGTPSYADFNIFHHMDNALTVFPEALSRSSTGVPHLEAWMGRMRKLPRLAEYLENRPRVVDVGTDPGLQDRNGKVVKQREGSGRCWLRDGLFCEE